jgi:urease accessory protein
MLDAIALSGEVNAAAEARLPRAHGVARIVFKRCGPNTVLNRLYQQGSLRVCLPRMPAGERPEAILLNTAGGATGGDAFHTRVLLQPGAAAVVTSQAAERIYRSGGGEALIENRLELGAGASLDWLPQETILFDRCRLERRLSVDLGIGATLLAVEALILGRQASGERVTRAHVVDSWRIRRDGRLVFADTLRLEGDVAGLSDGTAILGGATATALLVLVSPDSERRLEPLREALARAPCEAGASAWNGLLTARILASDGRRLRAGLLAALGALRDRIQSPRVWLC